MKLPSTAHTSQPWRIHEIAPDLRLEDVWALPTPGGPDDFPVLVALMASGTPTAHASAPVRVLWGIRHAVGGLLGWDEVRAGAPTLRDRLPADLRDGPTGPDLATRAFTPLYLTEAEWAAEIVNRTVHGVLHLGWVPDGEGGYHGQMAVLVRPNGLLGAAYMKAITPFRLALVYPQLLRQLGRSWRRRTAVAA